LTYTTPARGVVTAGLTLVLLAFFGGLVTWPMISKIPEPQPSRTNGTGPGNRPVVEVKCHGQSCTGQDPVDKGCDKDAETVDSFADGSFEVRLRFSPSCRAAWAQVHPFSNTYVASIEAYRLDLSEFVAEYHTGAKQYSRMFSFQYQVRACAVDGAREKSCTGFHH
jgi:hypothetical protein